jgi:hypothetical protein
VGSAAEDNAMSDVEEYERLALRSLAHAADPTLSPADREALVERALSYLKRAMQGDPKLLAEFGVKMLRLH